MDFFEHQERARRRTGVLIFYFILAVVGIILATYALATGLLYFLDDGTGTQSLWRPEVLVYTAIGTSVIVFLASAFKSAQLSGGGAVVARELGGREIDLDTRDYHERRLLNIVEEMAIASGVPAPTVFLLDSEDSINAFAAGKTPSDAVIGVTRGCMTLLTRDELQGVIAHEFSHILNGDMRLNIRLMAVLFGILFLALMGELIMRFGVRGSLHSGRREGVGAALILLIAGLGLLAIGYLGNFFGNLIKASVSRQREFLADASAVQFTRNPEGLAGALKKIGGFSSGSRVGHPMARDASHLFFGSALRSSIFATHPPIEKRIQRLLPHWNGEYGSSRLPTVTEESDSSPAGGRSSEAAAVSMLSSESPVELSASEASESLRGLHPEQIEVAHELHEQLPDEWKRLCHNRDGSRAVVFALLLAQDKSLRAEEIAHLQDSVGSETSDLASHLAAELQPLHSRIKLGIVDLCIPTLRRLSRSEYQQFRSLTEHLVRSDQQIDLFEFTLLKVIRRHLDGFFDQNPADRIRYRHLSSLQHDAAVLLTTLAAVSHPEDQSAIRSAFETAVSHLTEMGNQAVIPFLPAEQCGLRQVDEALERFAHATPLVKRDLLEAACHGIIADGKISSREAELIRAIADAIGCPIPPFVKTAPLY